MKINILVIFSIDFHFVTYYLCNFLPSTNAPTKFTLKIPIAVFFSDRDF